MCDANLKAFLSNPGRSRAREYLLTTRLVHDLSAAAARGYDLLVYLPTVDADGFDVILDDRDRLVPIQLKSVIEGGGAAAWTVRRALIRPEGASCEIYGFEPSPSGAGRGGGVILTTVRAEESTVKVRYAYTDIDILSAMWMGLFPRAVPQLTRLQRLRTELEAEPGGDIEVPRSAFIRAASPEHLLALAGLHSREKSSWRSQLDLLLRHQNSGAGLPAPEEGLRRGIASELARLSDHPSNPPLQPTGSAGG